MNTLTFKHFRHFFHCTPGNHQGTKSEQERDGAGFKEESGRQGLCLPVQTQREELRYKFKELD